MWRCSELVAAGPSAKGGGQDLLVDGLLPVSSPRIANNAAEFTIASVLARRGSGAIPAWPVGNVVRLAVSFVTA